MIKGAYVVELNLVQDINEQIIDKKCSLYKSAILWAIAAIVPYIIATLNHTILKDVKVHGIYMGK